MTLSHCCGHIVDTGTGSHLCLHLRGRHRPGFHIIIGALPCGILDRMSYMDLTITRIGVAICRADPRMPGRCWGHGHSLSRRQVIRLMHLVASHPLFQEAVKPWEPTPWEPTP